LAGGRLTAQKGLFVLLDAWRLLVQRGVEVPCDIVGDGPLRGELEQAIQRLRLRPWVRLVGAMPHPQLMRAIARSRGFVLPCLRTEEGFVDGIPNILAETMALDRPVVSTRLSGIPELIEDGVSGYLAEPGDAVSLADKIQAVVADELAARAVARRGREVVRSLFALQRNVSALAEELGRSAGIVILEPGQAETPRHGQGHSRESALAQPVDAV
jgi:glycosyltransferase involved in cell wall biosynthesis